MNKKQNKQRLKRIRQFEKFSNESEVTFKTVNFQDADHPINVPINFKQLRKIKEQTLLNVEPAKVQGLQERLAKMILAQHERDAIRFMFDMRNPEKVALEKLLKFDQYAIEIEEYSFQPQSGDIEVE